MENNAAFKVQQENRCGNSKKTSILHKIRYHFRSYCNHTSIHGFQYFGQNRTIIEKCWWILIFIGIIASCAFTIYLIYKKWLKSPVIVSLTTRDTPIYQVPFPAVTICPTIKFSKEDINFSDYIDFVMSANHENDTDSTGHRLELFQYMLPLCKMGLLFDFDIPLNTSTTSDGIYKTFLDYSPFTKISHMNYVSFMEDGFNFRDSFKPILTDDGLCFTFNMLSTDDIFTEKVYIPLGYNTSGPKSFWIPQHGYSKDADLNTYPRRALLSGALYSLEVRIFHFKKDIDYKCTGSEQGYKVILHLPTRVPRSSLEYIMVPFSKDSTITVKPEMMTTSEVVKSYSPENRDCFFQGEKQLSFFKLYSKTNCELECLTNYTLRECDCVSFHMPREKSTSICGLDKLSCLNTARRKYNLAKLKSKITEFKEKSFKDMHKKRLKRHYDPLHDDLDEDDARCNCLRACNDITYTGTATTMEYNWRKEFFDDENFNSSDYDFTMMTIFLASNTIFTTERNELYGPTDFLSNFGGLLGLFTGFSFLSLMEIIYFCTLRIFGNRKLFGKWYGDREED